MRATLESDARRADVGNTEIVPFRWEETRDPSGDLVIASHVVYPAGYIEPFIRHLDAAPGTEKPVRACGR